MSLRVRKDDKVKVLLGKDRGKAGKVLQVFPSRQRALVEGLNMVKKHRRRTKEDQQGGIISKEASLHLSNLMLICPSCSKATRLSVRELQDGSKVRRCIHCEATF